MTKNPNTTRGPSAIWAFRKIVFDKDISLSDNAILAQGSSALRSLITKIDQLYELVYRYPNITNIYPSPEIPSVLTELCFHHGMASSILFNDSGRTRRETVEEYRSRIERYNYVKKFCDAQNVPTAILADRVVRNKMVHVDEHLARRLRQPNTGWVFDSALHNLDWSTEKNLAIEYCRVFVGSRNSIIHLGSEISLPHLRHEAVAVSKVVFGEEPPEPPKPRSHSLQFQAFWPGQNPASYNLRVTFQEHIPHHK